MRNNPKEYYHSTMSNLNGTFRGIIEDNDDPKKLGRCRIRIFGIHTPNKTKTNDDGIPTNELPWAEAAMGLFGGSVSGYGSWTVPLQGSHVFVFFEGGHILKPRFFATVPGYPTDKNHGFRDDQGFSDPDGKYPDRLNESDFHRLSRGVTNDTLMDTKEANRKTGITYPTGATWDEPESSYNASYPNNNVFSSSSGMVLEIDDSEKNGRFHFYHPSNTYFEINKDGDFVFRTGNQGWYITDSHKREYIGGGSIVSTGGGFWRKIGTSNRLEVGTFRNVEVGSDFTVDVGGDYDITVTGDYSVNATGTVTLTGSTLSINGTSVRGDGTIAVSDVADGDASNNSIYYSTTQSTLVWKDKVGNVIDLTVQ